MNIPKDLESAIHKAAAKLWPAIELPEVVVSPSPKPEFGDYSSPVALSLAKLLNRQPEEVADELRNELGSITFIDKITVSKPGFVNFALNYPLLAKEILASQTGYQAKPSTKISIEHTSVNPNKAAHIGHLRNACLGDSLARLLRAVGQTVEVQNYIDDLGVQVADSVVAFETFGDAPEGYATDEWMWQIYAQIGAKYEGQPELVARREEVQKEMEAGENQTAKEIVSAMVKAHESTFAKFGIQYDLLVYEHDIVGNQLWDNLFENLKTQKLITQPKTGDHKDAWVVEFGEEEREDKILVRSNGIPTYTAKDLAYALWKFGKRPEMPQYPNRLTDISVHINVIDERQSYPQTIIKYVMEQLGYTKEASHYHHLAYGVVKLSDKAFAKLGQVAGDKKTYSMSGRAGIGVMVNDLVKTAVNHQIEQFESTAEVAEQIAIGSIRYYMLKSRPVREITFDFDTALQSDGNTGVYLQYAFARANNILSKTTLPASSTIPATLVVPETNLLLKIAELDGHLEIAVAQRDPSLLCDYAYTLANTFAKFYETTPVLKADNTEKIFRLYLVKKYSDTLEYILNILGIPTIAKI